MASGPSLPGRFDTELPGRHNAGKRCACPGGSRRGDYHRCGEPPPPPTDLIIDINGTFAAAASGGLRFIAVTPCRVADTRSSQGFPAPFGAPSLVGNSSRNFPIQLSPCGIPATAARPMH